MRISTPTATLGIRGTTGLVEVPEGATATSNNVAIKLYPDPDGRVGRIEINDRRSGVQLGTLTRGASGFAIRGRHGRRAPCRGAADDLAAAGFARSGVCAPASLDAGSRPAHGRRAARLPSRQSRPALSEPRPAAATGTAAAEWLARTKPHHAAGAGAAWPSGAAARSTEPSRPAATRHAEPAGRATAASGHPAATGASGRPDATWPRPAAQPSRPARRRAPAKPAAARGTATSRAATGPAAAGRTAATRHAALGRAATGCPANGQAAAFRGAAASRSTVRTTATACAAAGCAGRAPRAAAGIAEPAGTAPGSGAEREKGTGPVLNDGKRGIRPRGAASPGPFE